MCPPSERLDATGIGLPSEPHWDEIGPALKFASQIMISFWFDPPAVFEVKRSYATSATIEPEVDCDHFHVDCVYDHPQTPWAVSTPATREHRAPERKSGDAPACS